jgi:hypothetical protein
MANKKRYYYHATSVEDRINAINILLSRGFAWHSSPKYSSGSFVEREYGFAQYNVIVIDMTRKELGGWVVTEGTVKSSISFGILSKL